MERNYVLLAILRSIVFLRRLPNGLVRLNEMGIPSDQLAKQYSHDMGFSVQSYRYVCWCLYLRAATDT